MIKFLMGRDDRVVLGIILIKENIDNLCTKEFPIHFNAEDMHLNALIINEIIIDYRDTTEEAIQFLKSIGSISNNTQMIQDTTTKH